VFWLDAEIPFVYVTDSMDALDDGEEREKIEKARAKGGKVPANAEGLAAKARKNSAIMRRLKDKIANTKSLVIIISQVRTNIGVTFGSTKYRAGGKALEFYSSTIMWLSCAEKLSMKVRGIDRKIGAAARYRVTKNRLNGKLHDIIQPMYWAFGLDDIGAMVRFLVEEKEWPCTKGRITPKGIEGVGANFERDLCRLLTEKRLEDQVAQICLSVWTEVQDLIKKSVGTRKVER